jgi:nucleoside phosphorylase
MDNLDLVYRRITARPSRRTPPSFPFPDGTAPRVISTRLDENSELPEADALVVTYTEAEGEALADILTPGTPLQNWTDYKNGWSIIHQLIEGGRAPSLFSKCAGQWALISIGDTKVVVMKSNMHPATDGPKLPIATAWKRWISQAKPKLVISTGTAGAVQTTTQLGDVIVSKNVSWDCRRQFKNASFAGQKYTSALQFDSTGIERALPLLSQTTQPLPGLTRAPSLWLDSSDQPAHVITTDFFAFDDEENSYGLRSFDPQARAVEMDDAAMAMVMSEVQIPWLIIRNASDPCMPKEATVEQEAKDASHIYEKWGQVTSWGSALTCWAALAKS